MGYINQLSKKLCLTLISRTLSWYRWSLRKLIDARLIWFSLLYNFCFLLFFWIFEEENWDDKGIFDNFVSFDKYSTSLLIYLNNKIKSIHSQYRTKKLYLIPKISSFYKTISRVYTIMIYTLHNYNSILKNSLQKWYLGFTSKSPIHAQTNTFKQYLHKSTIKEYFISYQFETFLNDPRLDICKVINLKVYARLRKIVNRYSEN